MLNPTEIKTKIVINTTFPGKYEICSCVRLPVLMDSREGLLIFTNTRKNQKTTAKKTATHANRENVAINPVKMHTKLTPKISFAHFSREKYTRYRLVIRPAKSKPAKTL